MKKKIALLATVTLLTGVLTACSKDVTYLSEMKASDYVTLGEYKGIEVTVEEPAVAEEDVDAYINSMLTRYGEPIEVTDRAVEEGDTVNIDYTGYQDGVAFEGGTAQGQSLTIGSGQFIPGFEEGLIGANIGDEVSLDLTFPDNYHSAELAGASVTFDVKVNGISVYELTDEFVQGLGIEECSTVGEYRDYVNGMLYADAVTAYNQSLQSNITSAVMANSVFQEVPEKMVDRYYDVVVESISTQAAAYGMDLATFMQNAYGLDADSYPEALREEASNMAQQYIMFQAIADVEDLNMSEEELTKAIEERVSVYGFESVEQFEEQSDIGTLEEYLMAEEVMAFLVDNAVINTATE